MNSDMALTWLGQSGFILQSEDKVFACDLYLSDYCTKISRLDHTRKMPIPVMPEKLDYIDHYLVTHPHADHFDPETIGAILKTGRKTVFYCPPSCTEKINKYLPYFSGRFKFLKSEKEYLLADNIRLFALPAAHEELEKDASGEYVSFSYLLIFDSQKRAVFFAGDTIPFDGQAEMIKKLVPEGFKLTCVLPVNGRDEDRSKLGFKGNLTVVEAADLCNKCGASLVVPCHFGMFELNDAKEEISQKVFREKGCMAVIPELKKEILL